jgi:hypothetical protein
MAPAAMTGEQHPLAASTEDATGLFGGADRWSGAE